LYFLCAHRRLDYIQIPERLDANGARMVLLLLLMLRSCEGEFESGARLPVIALLTGETLEVVDVGARPHHHLEGGDHFCTRRAIAGVAE
jgi:hypothetical protein